MRLSRRPHSLSCQLTSQQPQQSQAPSHLILGCMRPEDGGVAHTGTLLRVKLLRQLV